VARGAAEALYYVLPNFAYLNAKERAVHNLGIDPGASALAIAYAISYVAAVVLAAMAIFQRREFT
jgi:hypothetical protein